MEKRTTQGTKMNKKNIKIMVLNKGNSQLQNKVDQINNLISVHKPDIFALNKLNLHKTDTVTKYQFNGYHLETDNLDKTDHTARTGVLISDKILYKRRRDLEIEGCSTVWIQIRTQEKKQFLIQSIYRQFTRLGKPNTSSIKMQNDRIQLISSKWMDAQNENREIITVGDFNINSINWGKHYMDKSDYDKMKHKMYKTLKENNLENGNDQINTERTRESENGIGGPACLDMAFTTDPARISSHQTIFPTFSDHTLVIINRNSNQLESHKSYRKARYFKDFKREKFKQDILEHHLYIENLYEREPEIINKNLTKILQDCLDIQAPIKTIQISSWAADKLSEEARELIVARDTAHEQWKNYKNPENWRKFKNMRNKTNRFISKERFTRKV